jgi:hypothetical protein
MGRGRAKAKQTKVARQLKYNAPHTDLEALQAELSGQSKSSDDDEVREEEYDPYDEYSAEDDSDAER